MTEGPNKNEYQATDHEHLFPSVYTGTYSIANSRHLSLATPRPSRKTGYWVGGVTSSPPLEVGVDTIPILRMNLTRNPELFTRSLTPDVLNCRQCAVLIDGHTKTPRRRMFDTLWLGLVL